MQLKKTSELFVDHGEGSKLLTDGSCMILEKVTLKRTNCRRSGYYVDCRNCNVPLIYPDIAQRLIADRLRI
ncbi:MAG TPA: hypothetical protein VLH13_03135 [Methanomassiliicoccales archaeon]|nr:hypothetical protein [Methanomassiliicoccales archaeon]